MGLRPTLDELEQYGQELYAARRDNRVPKYRDPRQVFAEDPNREGGFLVEKDQTQLDDEQKAYDQAVIDEAENKAQVEAELAVNGNVIHGDQTLPDTAAPENPPSADLSQAQVQQIIANAQEGGELPVPTNPTPVLADPGQELAHQLSSFQNDVHSGHPNNQNVGGSLGAPEILAQTPEAPVETPVPEVPPVADPATVTPTTTPDPAS